MSKKKANIVAAIIVWVIAIEWFVTGYIYGQCNMLERLKDRFEDFKNTVRFKWDA